MYQYRVEVVGIDPPCVLPCAHDNLITSTAATTVNNHSERRKEKEAILGGVPLPPPCSSSFSIFPSSSLSSCSTLTGIGMTAGEGTPQTLSPGVTYHDHGQSYNENNIIDSATTLSLRLYFLKRRAVLSCTEVPQQFLLRCAPLEDHFFLAFYDGTELVARSHHRIAVGGLHRQQGCCWIEMRFSGRRKMKKRTAKIILHAGGNEVGYDSGDGGAVEADVKDCGRPSSLSFSTSSGGASSSPDALLLFAEGERESPAAKPEVLRVGGSLTGMCRVRVLWEICREDSSVFFQLPRDFLISMWSTKCGRSISNLDGESREKRNGEEGEIEQEEIEGRFALYSDEDAFSFVSIDSQASLVEEDGNGEKMGGDTGDHPLGGLPSTEEGDGNDAGKTQGAVLGSFSFPSSFRHFLFFAQSTTRLVPPSFPVLAPPSPPPATTNLTTETALHLSSLPSPPPPPLVPPPLWFSVFPEGSRSGMTAGGGGGIAHGHHSLRPPPTLVAEDTSCFLHLITTPSPEEVERCRRRYMWMTRDQRSDYGSGIPFPPPTSKSILDYYHWREEYLDDAQGVEGKEKWEEHNNGSLPFRKSALFIEMKERNFQKMKGI